MIVFKLIRKIINSVLNFIYTPVTKIIFVLNGVKINKGLVAFGIPKIIVTRRGNVKFGVNLMINSGQNHNIIGRNQKTIFWVEGKLTIGDNVGMSSTAIICNHEIEIGDNVMIGGNTVIYDTNFHSLDPKKRQDKHLDRKNTKYGKVTIKNNVFIGAHTTILKGVTIDENSIIGACSVVSKDIPKNEVWAGNPAQFIRKIN